MSRVNFWLHFLVEKQKSHWIWRFHSRGLISLWTFLCSNFTFSSFKTVWQKFDKQFICFHFQSSKEWKWNFCLILIWFQTRNAEGRNWTYIDRTTFHLSGFQLVASIQYSTVELHLLLHFFFLFSVWLISVFLYDCEIYNILLSK